jgi:hypothetical protein
MMTAQFCLSLCLESLVVGTHYYFSALDLFSMTWIRFWLDVVYARREILLIMILNLLFKNFISLIFPFLLISAKSDLIKIKSPELNAWYGNNGDSNVALIIM